jgi:hypothetical protein
MLEPKEHYGKLHRQYHSPVPKTTTQSPAKVLKFTAFTLPFAAIHKIGNWSIKYSG